MTGSTHRQCWARQVSPCRGKLSREHFVSASVLEAMGRTSYGLSGPGLNAPNHKLPIGSMTARCLCEGHNNALSAVDQAGATLVTALRAMEQENWGKPDTRPPAVAALDIANGEVLATIDGFLVEQWLLKTYINILYMAKRLTLLPGVADRHTPPLQLAKAAFGIEPLSIGFGLTLFTHANPHLRYTSVEIDELIVDETILSCRFTLWGMPLYLRLSPEAKPDPALPLPIFDPAGIVRTLRDGSIRILDLTWTSQTRPGLRLHLRRSAPADDGGA